MSYLLRKLRDFWQKMHFIEVNLLLCMYSVQNIYTQFYFVKFIGMKNIFDIIRS